MTRGRKDRASGDEEVIDSVYTAILVNHTIRRRRCHAGSADMMAADRGAGLDLFVDRFFAEPQVGTSRFSEFVLDHVQRCLDGVCVKLVHLPAHADFWKAETIPAVNQRYTVVTVGALFAVDF